MKLIYTEEFKGDLRKIKDKKIQTRIKKLIQKIIVNPEIGKPLNMNFFLFAVLESRHFGFYMS
jgi:hypothetical protein